MRTLVTLLFAVNVLAAEIPVSEPIVGAAPRSQYRSTAASDGDGFLAIWTDQRAWPPSTFATRIASDGRVLDETGIRVVPYALNFPQVIWSGTSYVVAWSAFDGRMFVMRIDDERKLVELPQRGQPTSIASNGSHVVIAYVTSNEPHALFLTPDGAVVKDVKLADAGEINGPRIAWSGTQFAAAWVSFGATPASVVDVRFDLTGVVRPPRILGTPINARDVLLASDGTDFLVLPRDDFAVASLVWSGSHYVLVVEQGSKVTATRLDRNGTPVDPQATVIENVETIGTAPTPFATTNGSDIFVTWMSTPTTDGADIYGAVVDGGALTRTSRALLSKSAARQFDPVVASNGRNLLTVWRESSGVYARRTALDGVALDVAPLRLTPNAVAATAIAHGNDYIVAWLDDDEISTRHIASTGELQASGGTRFLASRVFEFTAASDGTTAMLAWVENNTLKAVRLNADATFVDTVPVEIAKMHIRGIAMSASHTDFLVAWGETRSTIEGSAIPVSVHAARITPALTGLDPDGILVAATDANEGDPVVTWDGRLWIVAWHWESNGEHEVRAGRVTTGGFALDCNLRDYGVTIVRDAQLPSIAWDGEQLRLAWRDVPLGEQPRAMYMATLDELGAELEGIRTLGDAELFARAVSFTRTAAAYSRIASEPRYGGVSRAFVDVAQTPPRRRPAR